VKIKYLSKGIIKSIPGVQFLYKFNRATGGTDEAGYCYAVWLRHLVLAFENGFTAIPENIAELGPGDSLGIGLAALISGAGFYMGLDIVKFAKVKKNMKIFDELVLLFKQRSAIPTTKDFPRLRPELANYDFPAHILNEEHLKKTLDENRLDKIRNSIKVLDDPEMAVKDTMIKYYAPWNGANTIEKESMDMILSQTVLQHMHDLKETYATMYTWLKKGGILSHRIDLSSAGFSDEWDGHRTYSDLEWRIVRGTNYYFINREPYSVHIQYLKDLNFRIISDIKSKSQPTVANKRNLAKRFRNLSEEDLSTSGVFLQAVK
jgi:SAM-dependent methyltransferase